MKRTLVALAAVSALAAAASAQARPDGPLAAPGVTRTAVVIGGTVPLSGPLSAFASVAYGAQAYFKDLNARGGVNGRRVIYKFFDDAFNPAQTVQLTRRLVQQERVFAVFNAAGTEPHLAVRKYLNDLGVPDLFVASGATTFGRDFREYPWTIGGLPSYMNEGTVLGRQILKTTPNVKIAVLFQNDDYGKDLLNGLARGLGPDWRKIVVQSQGHEVTAADVGAQVARLASSRADTFFIATTPRFAIQAIAAAHKLGWKPKLVVNSVAASPTVMQVATHSSSPELTNGALSFSFLKDPADPRWRDDRGIRDYLRIMRTYASDRETEDVYHVYGMAAAYNMVEALRGAGKELTRKGLLASALRLNVTDNPFLLPGVVVRTSPTDHFPIEQGALQRWQNGRWIRISGLVSAPSK